MKIRNNFSVLTFLSLFYFLIAFAGYELDQKGNWKYVKSKSNESQRQELIQQVHSLVKRQDSYGLKTFFSNHSNLKKFYANAKKDNRISPLRSAIVPATNLSTAPFFPSLEIVKILLENGAKVENDLFFDFDWNQKTTNSSWLSERDEMLRLLIDHTQSVDSLFGCSNHKFFPSLLNHVRKSGRPRSEVIKGLKISGAHICNNFENNYSILTLLCAYPVYCKKESLSIIRTIFLCNKRKDCLLEKVPRDLLFLILSFLPAAAYLQKLPAQLAVYQNNMISIATDFCWEKRQDVFDLVDIKEIQKLNSQGLGIKLEKIDKDCIFKQVKLQAEEINTSS